MNRAPIHCLILIPAFQILGCAPAAEKDVYVGYVEAEYVYVAAPQDGWIEALNVREGDAVSAGEILFELDKEQQIAAREEAAARAAQAEAQARDLATGARQEEIDALNAQLEEAKAQFALAKAERDRWMPLVAEGNASAQRGDEVSAAYNAALARMRAAEEAINVAELGGRDAAREAAEAAAKSAKSALDEAEWRLNQRTVTAKVGGRVEEVFHRQGEYARAGTPVIALLPPNALKVRFFVPQAALADIELGASVEVRADSSPEVFPATVFHIASEVEYTPPVIYDEDTRDKLVFLVEARLAPGGRLRPGLPVDIFAP
jgi:HlyD family secretion protein